MTKYDQINTSLNRNLLRFQFRLSCSWGTTEKASIYYQHKRTHHFRVEKWKADSPYCLCVCVYVFIFYNGVVNVHSNGADGWWASGPRQATEDFSNPVPLLFHHNGQVENHRAAWHVNQPSSRTPSTHTHTLANTDHSSVPFVKMTCTALHKYFPPFDVFYIFFLGVQPGSETDFVWDLHNAARNIKVKVLYEKLKLLFTNLKKSMNRQWRWMWETTTLAPSRSLIISWKESTCLQLSCHVISK